MTRQAGVVLLSSLVAVVVAVVLFGSGHPLPATALILAAICVALGSAYQISEHLTTVVADARPTATTPRRWLQVLGRPSVLTSAALLVVGATVYPALPDRLVHHSSGQCWPKVISALVIPALGVAFGSIAAMMRPVQAASRRTWPPVVWLDLIAYLCCFASAYGLVPAALGYACR